MNNQIYGRANRLNLLKKIIISVVLVILVVVFVIVLINSRNKNKNENINYAYLKRYFNAKGFFCEPLENNASSCELVNDNIKCIFTRYGDGFKYTEHTESYFLDIQYIKSGNTFVKFDTTSKAIKGYTGKTYICKNSFDNILSPVEKCLTDDNEELDLKVYLGVVNNAINTLDEAIDASGYDKDVLLEKYVWQKK